MRRLKFSCHKSNTTPERLYLPMGRFNRVDFATARERIPYCVLGLVLGAFMLSIAVGAAQAVESAKSEAQINIDQLYEQAVRGENYQAAISEIVGYVENAELGEISQIYAINRLEDLAAVELKDYLRGIAEREIRFENSDRLRGYAHLAYWATLLAEASDEAEEQEIFVKGLEATIDVYVEGRDEPITGFGSPFVREWAVDELCRRGNPKYLGQIALSVKSYKSGKRAQQKIELCRRQSELLSKFDSRLAAFEYALETIDPTSEVQLVTWVLDEVFELRPNELDDLLASYLLRLENEFEIDSTGSTGITYRRAFSMLRKLNWTDEQFKERGIKPYNSI